MRMSSGRRSDRHEEIIREAVTLFAQQGVTRTSLADIAARVNIKKASLYHFFKSKEDLTFEVISDVVDSPYKDLQAIAESELDIPSKIVAGSAALGRAFGEQSSQMRVLVRENLDRVLSKEHFEYVNEKKSAYTQLWQNILQEGVKTGELRFLDPKLAAFGLIGSLNWMFAWYDPNGRLTGEEIGRIMGETFLRGLLSNGATLLGAAPLKGGRGTLRSA